MKNRIYLNFLAVALFSVIFACNPKQEGTDAEVSEAKEVEEVVAAQEYALNTNESLITWIGSKPTGKHNGSIPVSNGTIAVEGDAIVGGSIDIDITGITCEDLAEKPDMQNDLINHLKSPDFFHADSFPSANFTITSVEKYSADEQIEVKEEFDTEFKPASADEFIVEAPTHKMTGNLTMRGKTLSVSFPAAVKMEDGKIMAKAKFNIDRTLWDLKYGDEASAVDKAKDKFIYNTVNVGLDVTAAAPSL